MEVSCSFAQQCCSRPWYIHTRRPQHTVSLKGGRINDEELTQHVSDNFLGQHSGGQACFPSWPLSAAVAPLTKQQDRAHTHTHAHTHTRTHTQVHWPAVRHYLHRVAITNANVNTQWHTWETGEIRDSENMKTNCRSAGGLPHGILEGCSSRNTFFSNLKKKVLVTGVNKRRSG